MVTATAWITLNELKFSKGHYMEIGPADCVYVFWYDDSPMYVGKSLSPVARLNSHLSSTNSKLHKALNSSCGVGKTPYVRWAAATYCAKRWYDQLGAWVHIGDKTYDKSQMDAIVAKQRSPSRGNLAPYKALAPLFEQWMIEGLRPCLNVGMNPSPQPLPRGMKLSATHIGYAVQQR